LLIVLFGCKLGSPSILNRGGFVVDHSYRCRHVERENTTHPTVLGFGLPSGSVTGVIDGAGTVAYDYASEYHTTAPSTGLDVLYIVEGSQATDVILGILGGS
jgi:hypothetical protein